MTKNTSIQKIILKILSRKNTISYDELQKEALKALKGSYLASNKPEYAISRTAKNLVSLGLLECFQSEKQPFFRLTSDGHKKINNNAINDDQAIIAGSWDGYWRIIILDMPEDRKNEREAIRYLLKKAGFACIKNSVWVSIYPYENLFINIKKDLGFTTEMMIIVTDKIDELTRKELLVSF
ncbi:MAG: hypothetical protein EOM85_00370 [Candidatus Moranbacteria bacterium]|nr:hypothetical protein [Candidatus Moranbacteria bacterium]